MSDYGQARLNMVDGQLRTNKVTDSAILRAFSTVPREIFVPEALRAAAYTDEHLALGGGRYLMEPRVTARLLQAAEIEPADRVLHIAGGTGYATALLAAIGAQVVYVESDPALVERARANLAGLADHAGLDRVSVREGPLALGAPDEAPFDVVFIDGAVTDIPPALSNQVRERGRLVTVLRPAASLIGHGVLVEKLAAGLTRRVLFETGAPLIRELARPPAFCL